MTQLPATNAIPATERSNPRTEGLDRLSTYEMLLRINEEDAAVAGAVRLALPEIALAVDAVADALVSGGRLIYVGAGTSGRLGCLDAAECLPTFGVSLEQVFGLIAGGEAALLRAVEGAEDDAVAGGAAIEAAGVGPADVVVGISASGGAPYVRAAARRARERGAKTIGVSNAPGALLSADVDIAIEVPTGPEVIAGSTRLKAGTAQKLVLNMLSTAAMVRIGKTYGNRMVDVQATNAKLRRRANGLLREIGGVGSDAEAEILLTDAGGSVKTAILMARAGLTADEARERLRIGRGVLSQALGEGSG
jgi:N-acetylmuramic acid 6-phosphate etherase